MLRYCLKFVPVLFLILISACQDTTETATKPSQAKNASDVFIEKVNKLEVIRHDDFPLAEELGVSYSTKTENNERVTTYSYTPKSRSLLESSRGNGNNPSWTITTEGVEPLCDERQVKYSRQLFFSSGPPTESNETFDSHTIMGLGEYRLLCTKY